MTEPGSPIHLDTVLPDKANGGGHVAREVSTVTGWLGKIVLLLLFLTLAEIGLSTYTQITLSERVSHNAKVASLRSCADVNENRKELVDFIDNTLTQSEEAARALIESPTSTSDQRTVAAKNLITLKLFRADADRRLAPSKCVYPPPTPPTPKAPR